MKRVCVAGWLFLGVVAPPSARAQALVEDVDRVGENIVAEAEAVRGLLQAVELELASGRLELTASGAEAWSGLPEGWEQVRNLAMAGDYGPAYKSARALRADLRTALAELYVRRPAPALTEALRAWVDVIGPRVDALSRQIENYPLTQEGRESYHVSGALWEDARKAAKKKKWDVAFRMLIDALVEMDRVVYEAYPTSR